MPAAVVVIATVIFPGTGHLLLRRYLKGSVLAALFAASLDVFLISVFLPHAAGWPLTLVGLGIMAGTWLYGLADIRTLLKLIRSKDFQKRKDDMLKSAQVAWLKSEYDEAERLLRAILLLDERDVEAWVLLGKVLKSCGRDEDARKSFRSALNLDGGRAWRWELMTELGYSDIKETVAETEAEPTQDPSRPS